MMVSWKEEEREYFAFCQQFAFGFALLVNLVWSFNKGVNFEAVKVADDEDCFKTKVQMFQNLMFDKDITIQYVWNAPN